MFERLQAGSQGPVCLNEGAYRSELVLKKMQSLRSCVSPQDRDKLERDIQLTRAGIVGEKRIAFELSSSHYPLAFIRDLCLEYEGQTCQIDFLVISPYNAFVIECKNLVGNITIDETGAFIRTFGTGRYRQTEGIYSPIRQNERHIELIKAMVYAKNGTVGRFILRHLNLDTYYHSLVVLANDKTVLNMRKAPASIRPQVVRADQLISTIKKMDKASAKKYEKDSFKQVRKTAEMWLSRNTPTQVNLEDRYMLIQRRDESVSELVDERIVSSQEQAFIEPGIQVLPAQGSSMLASDQTPELVQRKIAVQMPESFPVPTQMPASIPSPTSASDQAPVQKSETVPAPVPIPTPVPVPSPPPNMTSNSAALVPMPVPVPVPSPMSNSASDSAVPSCPLCGAPMRLRVARSGRYAGRQFWGCSRYGSSGCRGIINIDTSS